MNEILMTNIFFIITGSVILVLGILGVIILIQIIKILATARRIENKFHDIINRLIK